jgi:hypothetical protein
MMTVSSAAIKPVSALADDGSRGTAKYLLQPG